MLDVVTIPLGGLIVALLFCGVAHTAGAVPMRDLAKGALSGITEPLQQVITDRGVWQEVWAKHSANTSPATKPPAVDFNKEDVIAVTMGRQRTGGYTIQIIRVETDGKKLRIFVKRTSPPAGAMVIQALTAPFHFVAVPKHELPPEFVEVKAGPKK